MGVAQSGAVAVGGAVGAVGRALAGELLPLPGPATTLLVNVTGALALGALLARVRSPIVRAGLGTGVLGAWTTFSTLAVELVDLLGTDPVLAVGYAAASLVGGVAGARLGRTGATGPPP